MIRVPDKSKFPGTGADGNGIPVRFKTQDAMAQPRQDQRLRQLPSARQLRHAQHSGGARPLQLLDRRVGAPPAVRPRRPRHDRASLPTMMTPDGGHLAALADWTDRIKAGELPSATPPRPVGVERNIVVTVRDWSDPKHYLHDLTLTDKRQPTVNGYGLIYGAAELSTDNLPVLDPVKNTKTTMKVPVADPKYAPSSALANPVLAPSPYFGDGAGVGQPGQRPQSDDGPGRPRLLHGADPLAEGPAGLLQDGFADPFGAALSARRDRRRLRAELAPGHGLGSEHQEVLLHRYLLRHPSSQLRRGCQQHALALQQHPGQARRGRLDQHQDILARPATPRSRKAGPR